MGVSEHCVWLYYDKVLIIQVCYRHGSESSIHGYVLGEPTNVQLDAV